MLSSWGSKLQKAANEVAAAAEENGKKLREQATVASVQAEVALREAREKASAHVDKLNLGGTVDEARQRVKGALEGEKDRASEGIAATKHRMACSADVSGADGRLGRSAEGGGIEEDTPMLRAALNAMGGRCAAAQKSELALTKGTEEWSASMAASQERSGQLLAAMQELASAEPLSEPLAEASAVALRVAATFKGVDAVAAAAAGTQAIGLAATAYSEVEVKAVEDASAALRKAQSKQEASIKRTLRLTTPKPGETETPMSFEDSADAAAAATAALGEARAAQMKALQAAESASRTVALTQLCGFVESQAAYHRAAAALLDEMAPDLASLRSAIEQEQARTAAFAESIDDAQASGQALPPPDAQCAPGGGGLQGWVFFDRRKCWGVLHADELNVYNDAFSGQPLHSIGLFLCTVRVPLDNGLRFAFELVTQQDQLLLQVESEEAAVMWREAVQNAIAKYLTTMSSPTSASLGGQPLPLEQIQEAEDNKTCADCASATDCTWACMRFGVMVCLECSGVHRALGVDVSKMRSATLDTLSKPQVDLVLELGNKKVNTVLEAELVEADKPAADSTREVKEAFIKSKYADRKWFKKAESAAGAGSLLDQFGTKFQLPGTTIDLLCALQTPGDGTCSWSDVLVAAAGTCSSAKLELVLQHVGQGGSKIDEALALHAAAAADGDRSEAVWILLAHGANAEKLDASGESALQVGEKAGHKKVVALLADKLEELEELEDARKNEAAVAAARAEAEAAEAAARAENPPAF